MSFYAVKKGIEPGIYPSWEECAKQIEGFSGAEYKKFKTEAEATDYMNTKTVSTGLNLSAFAYKDPVVNNKDPVVNNKDPVVNNKDPVVNNKDESNPLSDNALSVEQVHAFEQYRLGHNVFITGPGGTGKSYLIKTIKADLEQREIKHAVCGLTGCASVLLNCCAKTIHSWSGVGLGAGEIHDIVDKAVKNRKANANWKTTRVLIVDEVSMMSVKIFDALNKIGQTIRRNHLKPFGGMQIIFIGDFYQLPPVGRYTEPETTMFCFQSANWFSTFSKENHIVLKTLFRQKDPTYIKVLDEVRQGVISEESVDLLKQRTVAKYEDNGTGIIPTKLFPRNADADRVNQLMYMRLKDNEQTYNFAKHVNMQTYAESGKPIQPEILIRCADLSREDVDQQLELLMENCKVNKELKLKKGALVMCLANLDIDAGICNGSQGVITSFVQGKTAGLMYPIVRFLNGIQMQISPKIYQHGDYPRIGIEQLPLRLAWAFTIHKSQGITLDIAEMDLGSNVFEYGQSYVGLSRVRSLEGLYLSGFNPQKIKTNPAVTEFYKFTNFPMV
jgi:ATP-dependent DNA helicase PIF1